MTAEIFVDHEACRKCHLVKKSLREAEKLGVHRMENPQLASIHFECAVDQNKKIATLTPFDAQYFGIHKNGSSEPIYKTRAVPNNYGASPKFCPQITNQKRGLPFLGTFGYNALSWLKEKLKMD